MEAFLKGLVQNTLNSSAVPDGGPLVFASLGRHAEQLVDQLHGEYFYPTLRGLGYSFDVTGVTVPVIAASLVSVFSLWNPPGSNVIAELVDVDIDQVLAATVVNTFGWYYSSGASAQASTFTTIGTAKSRRVGDAPANKVLPYSALTHSGTPVRADIIGGHGATTNNVQLHKEYNGRLLLPPGVVISLAASTGANTASGLGLGVSWIEWPFTV